MPYEVVKQLKFRPGQGQPMLTINPGEDLDKDLLGHWYVKAAIKDGRVRLLPEETKEDAKATKAEADAKAEAEANAEAKAEADATAKAEADATAKAEAKGAEAKTAKASKTKAGK